MKEVKLDGITIANNKPFTLIAGPCQMESRDHAFECAVFLKELCQRLAIPLIFKTSFDKANRTSIVGKRGIGLEQAIPVFAEIKEKLNLPLLTDVHNEEQIPIVAEVVDVLQIPAFLCRQTDMLIAAGKSGRIINVKKGQFLAPWDMKSVAEKIASTGNENILLTERGVSFGYNTLISDMRALPIMAQTGYPVIFDATHSVQQPSGMGRASGGDRRFVEVLARAAISTCIAGIFMETHPDPDNAPSDGPCMVPMHDLERILDVLQKLDTVAKNAMVKI